MNITDQVLLGLALALHFAVIMGAAFVIACWWFARPPVRSSEKIAIAADDYLMQFNARALKHIGADMHHERQTSRYYAAVSFPARCLRIADAAPNQYTLIPAHAVQVRNLGMLGGTGGYFNNVWTRRF